MRTAEESRESREVFGELCRGDWGRCLLVPASSLVSFANPPRSSSDAVKNTRITRATIAPYFVGLSSVSGQWTTKVTVVEWLVVSEVAVMMMG